MILSSGFDFIQKPYGLCYDAIAHDIYEDRTNGMIVCQKCGLIFEESMLSPELSLPQFNEGSQKSNLYREFISVSSNCYFSTLQPKFQDNIPQTLGRALKQNRQLSWKEKKEIIGLQELKKIVEKNSLSLAIKEQAINLFRKAIKDLHFRGKQIRTLIYACLYYSMKQNQSPIEILDLLKDDIIEKKRVLKYYYDLIHYYKLPIPIINSLNYINLYANTLHIDSDVHQIARDLYRIVSTQNQKNFLDHKGIAIVCLYLACKISNIPCSHMDIARIAKISPETLRYRLKAGEKIISSYVKTLTTS